VAAVWVVLFHLTTQIRTLFGTTPFDAVSRAGYLGVDIFFILSGFIISFQYMSRFRHLNGRVYASYLWARLARIYPLQLFTLCFLLILVLGAHLAKVQLSHASSYTRDGFILDLTLLRSWVTNNQGWNFPAWSLSAEWFAYVMFPVIAAVLSRRLGIKVRLLAVAIVLITSAVVVKLASEGRLPVPLPIVVVTFLLGSLGYTLFRDRVGQALPWSFASTLAIVGLLVGTSSPSYFMRGSIAILSSFVLILGLAFDERGAIARIFASKPFVYGGKISFALYMTHNIVLDLLSHILPTTSFMSSSLPIRAAILTVYALATAIVAALTYHVIEVPAQVAMKRMILRRNTGRERSS
jgi:peptidoglycan/LPS O-acetylase OafA/YrhL